MLLASRVTTLFKRITENLLNIFSNDISFIFVGSINFLKTFIKCTLKTGFLCNLDPRSFALLFQPHKQSRPVHPSMFVMLWASSSSKTRHQHPLHKNPTAPHASSYLKTLQCHHCVLVIILECVSFNMGLANERRQGMLQASSSWLTCIWHNVPCTDRCRVAVWSSGLYHGKTSRRDWRSGRADSMNYGGLIRACWKWFSLLQIMVI